MVPRAGGGTLQGVGNVKVLGSKRELRGGEGFHVWQLRRGTLGSTEQRGQGRGRRHPIRGRRHPPCPLGVTHVDVVREELRRAGVRALSSCPSGRVWGPGAAGGTAAAREPQGPGGQRPDPRVGLLAPSAPTPELNCRSQNLILPLPICRGTGKGPTHL